MSSSQDLLSLYQNGLQSEQQFIQTMEKRVCSQPELTEDVVDAKENLQPTMVLILTDFNDLQKSYHFAYWFTSLQF